MNKFLDDMVNMGILSNKELFVEGLKKHNLAIDKEMVEAIGYDGETEFVPIDTESIFICCTCSRYCISGYDGACDTCNRCRCARCARGNAVHPCTTEVEEYSSSESDEHFPPVENAPIPTENHYEINVNDQKYQFIGFVKKQNIEHCIPCSFRKLESW